jgi:FtsZ-binding cell division protein ZapB
MVYFNDQLVIKINHDKPVLSPTLKAVPSPKKRFSKPYNAPSMSDLTPIDQITERVDRLLLRYEELKRTNALLYQEIESLAQERDSLKSRLSAARARVDVLLARLPEANTAPASQVSTPRGPL